jgi:hypothetical protein
MPEEIVYFCTGTVKFHWSNLYMLVVMYFGVGLLIRTENGYATRNDCEAIN